MDTVGVNYYSAWYEYAGYPDTIYDQLGLFLENWYADFKKPFFMSEYGAGAVSGLHMVGHCTASPHIHACTCVLWGGAFCV